MGSLIFGTLLNVLVALIDAKTQAEVELVQPVPDSGTDTQLVVDWGM